LDASLARNLHADGGMQAEENPVEAQPLSEPPPEGRDRDPEPHWHEIIDAATD